MEPTPAFDMDPPSPTNKLSFDANSYEGSPAHAMNVPDRILIAGKLYIQSNLSVAAT